ncbi:hypothetical protein LINPERHAP2_LOCUS9632 [Linum perenne]
MDESVTLRPSGEMAHAELGKTPKDGPTSSHSSEKSGVRKLPKAHVPHIKSNSVAVSNVIVEPKISGTKA